MQQSTEHLLFLRVINLETDDISILDLALGECRFLFHKFDHPGFDFLQNTLGRLLEGLEGTGHLIQLQRSTGGPSHALVNPGMEVLHFAIARNIDLSNTI